MSTPLVTLTCYMCGERFDPTLVRHTTHYIGALSSYDGCVSEIMPSPHAIKDAPIRPFSNYVRALEAIGPLALAGANRWDQTLAACLGVDVRDLCEAGQRSLEEFVTPVQRFAPQ